MKEGKQKKREKESHDKRNDHEQMARAGISFVEELRSKS